MRWLELTTTDGKPNLFNMALVRRVAPETVTIPPPPGLEIEPLKVDGTRLYFGSEEGRAKDGAHVDVLQSEGDIRDALKNGTLSLHSELLTKKPVPAAAASAVEPATDSKPKGLARQPAQRRSFGRRQSPAQS